MTNWKSGVPGWGVKSNSPTAGRRAGNCHVSVSSVVGILFSRLSISEGNDDAESWDAFVGQMPKDKITTLIELIDAAKKHAQTEDE